MPIYYVDCLMIANTWIYISLYLRNTAVLKNRKTETILVNTLTDIRKFKNK